MQTTIKTHVSDEELLMAIVGLGATMGYAKEIVENRHVFERRGVNNAMRWAHFLGQCAHESAGFGIFEENLNYSWQALMRTWPSRFKNKAVAKKYHRKPFEIAEKVYGGRMGNVAVGDGWIYRGQGPIQTTGKNNYIQVSIANAIDCVDRPAILSEDPVSGLLAALTYFEKTKYKRVSLLEWCDKNASKAVTRAINGGYHGLNDRVLKTRYAMDVFMSDEGHFKRPIIRVGARGPHVKEMQQYLKVLGYVRKADGVYGKRTAAAVKQFQAKAGLVTDGIVGGQTMTTLATWAMTA